MADFFFISIQDSRGVWFLLILQLLYHKEVLFLKQTLKQLTFKPLFYQMKSSHSSVSQKVLYQN